MYKLVLVDKQRKRKRKIITSGRRTIPFRDVSAVGAVDGEIEANGGGAGGFHSQLSLSSHFSCSVRSSSFSNAFRSCSFSRALQADRSDHFSCSVCSRSFSSAVRSCSFSSALPEDPSAPGRTAPPAAFSPRPRADGTPCSAGAS